MTRDQAWVILGASGFVGSALVERVRQTLPVIPIAAPRIRSTEDHSLTALRAQAQKLEHIVSSLSKSIPAHSIVVNAAGVANPGAGASSDLYGANSVLPGLVAAAACQSGAARVIHLSSAAVQGNVARITTDLVDTGFSPYADSKAKGEHLFLESSDSSGNGCVVRATSVQGPGRRTTLQLQRVARSALSSVAYPGTQPTVVSSVEGLVDFIVALANAEGPLPRVIVQPWEGGTANSVLELAGNGRRPIVLPRSVCRTFLSVSRKVLPLTGHRYAGHIRRLELMWFGQDQDRSAETILRPDGGELARALSSLTKSTLR